MEVPALIYLLGLKLTLAPVKKPKKHRVLSITRPRTFYHNFFSLEGLNGQRLPDWWWSTPTMPINQSSPMNRMGSDALRLASAL